MLDHVQRPVSTTATTASFSFASTESGFDVYVPPRRWRAWTACSAPVSYKDLAAGQHTFAVRATDAAGNVDPTPATSSWTVTASSAPTGTTPGAGQQPASPTGTTPGSGQQPGATTPGTATTPGSGRSPTASPLQLTLTAKARQRLSRRSRLTVQVRCVKACSVMLSGKFVIATKPKHGLHSRPRTVLVRRLLTANVGAAAKRIALTIKLSSAARRALTAALTAKHRVTLTVSGVASARGMKTGSAHVTIVLVL